MDITDPTVAGVAGNHLLKSRYEYSNESGIVEMAGPIFCDVFFSERLLLSYVDLKVVINPSRHEFCLVSSVDNADFKVKLIDGYLKVCKVKVNPSVSLARKVALKKGPAIYPIRGVDCNSFVIPGGNPSINKECFRWICFKIVRLWFGRKCCV